MAYRHKLLKLIAATALLYSTSAITDPVFPGANEQTPSRSEYFSWINNTNEGTTTEHTLINLAFFEWLKREYGMQLDIYAFDAGAIDGKRYYGSTESERFKQQFPAGFDPIYQYAKKLNTRLGIWGGPDGFGNTLESKKKRIEMMVSLCKNYEFALFKFDAVAGQLRNDKQAAFADMMTKCRQASPDLILLNHRLNLGETGKPHATTFLWEGKETYIDVHLANDFPAPHNRAGALARGLPPRLSRLTEDHGVCLSSSLDYWDDELVLQAFNRALILSPQIYCNPWFLRDDEYPKLARIFNLAKQYKTQLVKGMVLPEALYGPSAVSRGDSHTRLITLRNLSWDPKTYTLALNEDIGLSNERATYQIKQLHPGERFIGEFKYNHQIDVQVEPFRSALILIEDTKTFSIKGVTYESIRDIPNQPLEVSLQGAFGESVDIQLLNHGNQFSKATIEGQDASQLLSGESYSLQFRGKPLQHDVNRYLGELKPSRLTSQAEALYETTIYAANNNALETRSIERSGPSNIPAVIAARNAFFEQDAFIDRGVWDKYLFDGDSNTAFYRMNRWNYNWNKTPSPTVAAGALRFDFGEIIAIDGIVLESAKGLAMEPLKEAEAIIGEVSTDLINWTEVRFLSAAKMQVVMPTTDFPVRYFRLAEAPQWLSEAYPVKSGQRIALHSGPRASNLFGHYDNMQFKQAWRNTFQLDEIAPDSYLSVGVAGEYGNEGVYAAVKVGDQYIGAPTRAPAYPANAWEFQVIKAKGNYTYYIPLDESWVGKPIDVVVLGRINEDYSEEIIPKVWLNRKPRPLATKTLVLDRR